MDRLREDDIRRTLETPLSERARQSIEAMAVGIKLKRVSIRARAPHLSEVEVEQELRKWLEHEH